MNQSSDFKSDDGNDDNVEANDGRESQRSIADENDEDEIKKTFIKKPSMEKVDSDDVKVKKEIDEAGAWEY